MNVAFQRAVDRYVGVPLCALFSVLDRLLPSRRVAAPPRTILVILLSEMGSLVLAQPMFVRLQEKYPGASIHAMLFTRNREVLDLLEIMPAGNVLAIDDRSLAGFVTDSLRTLLALWRLKADVVIDCELFARASSLFAFLSRAPIKIGFHRHTQEGLYRGSFINRRVLYNPYRHLSQQFLTLAGAIESGSTPSGKGQTPVLLFRTPKLAFAPDELAQAQDRFHADFPAVAGKRLIFVYPGGGILPIRAWPLDHYRELCDALLAEGYAIGVIGLRDDKPHAEALVAHCGSPHCIDLTGYTRSVRQLLALFHRASLLITNDGGPAQFAPLTPVPTIALFGPETPALYGPLGDNAFCFFRGLPCSPCLTAYNHRASPCDGDNQCLKQISPEEVLAQARRMLLRAPRSSESVEA